MQFDGAAGLEAVEFDVAHSKRLFSIRKWQQLVCGDEIAESIGDEAMRATAENGLLHQLIAINSPASSFSVNASSSVR